MIVQPESGHKMRDVWGRVMKGIIVQGVRGQSFRIFATLVCGISCFYINNRFLYSIF